MSSARIILVKWLAQVEVQDDVAIVRGWSEDVKERNYWE